MLVPLCVQVRSSLQVKKEMEEQSQYVYDVYVEDKEKQVHSLRDIEDYSLHVECFEEDLLFGGREYSSDEEDWDDGMCVFSLWGEFVNYVQSS